MPGLRKLRWEQETFEACLCHTRSFCALFESVTFLPSRQMPPWANTTQGRERFFRLVVPEGYEPTMLGRHSSKQQAWQQQQGTRSASSKRGHIGSRVGLHNLNAWPPWHTSSTKATPPKPLQTTPPTWNQIVKYSSLWGTLLTQETMVSYQRRVK